MLIKLNNNSISAVRALPSGIDTGKIGQIVSVTKTDTFTYSGTGLADVTGLSLSITPVATSSKIYLVANINIGSNARYTAFKFVRGSTDIGIGNAEGNRARVTVSSFSNPNLSLGNYQMPNSSASFLDSPSSTSELTYKIQMINNSGTGYLNRWGVDTGASGVSTITAIEILA